MKYALIIPSGGIGQRVGAEIPKQYLELQGKSILSWTLSRFKDFEEISQLLIPADDDFQEEIRKTIPESLIGKYKITPHGQTRFHSIYNSIEQIQEDIDYVMVHDAVRPLVSQELIRKLMTKVIKVGAVVPYLMPTDTIKQIDTEKSKNFVEKTLDREFLATVQTPQVFEKSIFVKAYQYAKSNQFKGTDDSSILEYSNIFPQLVLGEESNMKITSELDLELAKYLLNS